MTPKTRFLAAMLTLLAALLAEPALAQQKGAPETPKAAEAGRVNRNLALCIGCHGIPGYKTAFPVVYHVPKIAGQQPGYLVSALKEYRSGARSHPSMRGIAASLTDEDMEELAAHYGVPAK